MQRYFIYLSYDGAAYHGWQIQPNGLSVQECLMRALSTLLRREVDVVGAGRTDAGVHASLMVAHFDADAPVDSVLLADKLNRLLPPDIAIHCIRPVRPEPYRCRLFRTPDFDRMNEAAATLSDYTDFTSFSKLHTDVKTNNCRIMHAAWTQVDDVTWVFTIRADRFLRNMVRAIVGTLLDVGRGKLTVGDFRRIIEQKDRCRAGTSAPAEGLFLADITYPDRLFPTDND